MQPENDLLNQHYPILTYITPHIQDSEGIQPKIRAHKISRLNGFGNSYQQNHMQPQKRYTKPTLINSTLCYSTDTKFEGTLTRRTTSKIPYSFKSTQRTCNLRSRWYRLSTKNPTKSSRRGRSKQKAKCKNLEENLLALTKGERFEIQQKMLNKELSCFERYNKSIVHYGLSLDSRKRLGGVRFLAWQIKADFQWWS
ncbi:hypothetical protein CEXT_5901 [Caerostris extrusa]|uniref:Uncharacterized protein n=1 Tax=Caerostris extrusa TaxID=172846 RepID=A0AAV4YCG3_CAEEX|nr:hypothetical protein CEXT_5901 [Caerostris extrusa]